MSEEKNTPPSPETTPAQKPPESAAPAGPGPDAGDAPAPRPRPAKAAADDKPLADYLREDLEPLLTSRMRAEGADDIQVTVGEAEIRATWDKGDKQFTLYFDEGSLEGRKTIASSRSGSRGQTVQMFMPPERGFKGVDAKQIVTMIVIQFSTTLTWIQKQPGAKAAPAAAKAGKGKRPPKPA